MRSSWRLDQRQARLEVKTFRADIDLARPELGLHQLRIADRAVAPAHLLGLELPPTEPAVDRFVEAYPRGDDLVATYAGAQPPFRWQIYWRHVTDRFPHALAAIEAIVSVQTSLLDSNPRLMLQSSLSAAGITEWRSADRGGSALGNRCQVGPTGKNIQATGGWGCFSFELPDNAGSYVEMVHPADFDASSLEMLGGCSDTLPSGTLRPDTVSGFALRHRLFHERLEKGVILRSRVLAILLPAPPTGVTIADIQRAFSGEELPLTT